MEIAGFTIKNKQELDDGSKQFDLLYNNALIAHVTVDDMFFDVALDFKTDRKNAAATGKRLMQHYPYGFDKSYLYNDIGSIGVDSQAAYAGEYGSIVFLLEQLVRMDELEKLFIQNECDGSKSVVVYKAAKNARMAEVIIPNDRMQKFQHDVIVRNGVITFIGKEQKDFIISD